MNEAAETWMHVVKNPSRGDRTGTASLRSETMFATMPAVFNNRAIQGFNRGVLMHLQESFSD